MYRLLIIDDEPVTRQGIRSCLNWNLIDIEIVGEASNGLEGLIKIEECTPDIIICDVRMPRLDGIALANRVLPDHPGLQIIFLSGYSDKEYLKKAISLDAVDYIYKPFQLQELLAAVEKAKKNCMKRKNQETEKSDLALSLLSWSPDNPRFRDWPERSLNLSTSIETLVILLNPSRYNASESVLEKNAGIRLIADRYYPDFRETTRKLFGSRALISPTGTGYLVHTNAGDDFPAKAETLCQDFFSIIPGSSDTLSIGISNVSPDISGVENGYRQALSAAQSAFLVGWGKVLCWQNLSQIPFVPSREIAQQFYQPIGQKDFGSATVWIRNYIDYMRSCRVEDIPVIREHLAAILYRLREKHSNETEPQRYISSMVHTAADISEIEAFILADIQRYVTDLAQLDNKSRICMEAEQYILANLNKNLPIKDIAAHTYLTPNYLCYLYKKQRGKTIYHFILESKMAKAQELLREHDMKIGMVSEALGYANQNYFTRTFTKFFGISPSQYRHAHVRSSAGLAQEGAPNDEGND